MRRIALAATLPALLAGLLVAAPSARAATGLDPTYGDEGVATIFGSDEGVPEAGISVFGAIDSEGRVVRSLLSTNQLVRLTPEGEPDPTFGIDGMVDIGLGGGPVDVTDDGLVVAGRYGGNVAVALLDEQGDLVESFGDGGLATATSVPPGELVTVLQVVLGPDGAVTVASRRDVDGTDEHLVLQRFDSGGAPVADFGGTGAVVRDIDFPFFEGMDVDETGIVLVANHANGDDFADASFEVLRVRLDGSIDPTFGDNGKVTLAGQAAALEIDDTDGSVTIGGASHVGAEMWRFRRDGRVDGRFASGGGLPSGGEYVADLALLDQGRVAAALSGPAGSHPVVLGPDGEIDSGLAAVAPVPTGFGGLSGIVGAASDGRVLLVTSNAESDAGEARAYLTEFANLAPAVTEVVPYEDSLSVEWSAPEAGPPVRMYYVAVLHENGDVAGYSVASGDVRQASVERLNPLDETYDVVVLPYDEFGPAIASDPFEVAAVESAPPAGTASAVPGVEVAAGNGFATVSWDPPADDGGATVWGFSVIAVRHDNGALAGWRNVRSDVRQAAMPQLANGTAYDVYVVAVTTKGFGAIGSPVTVTPSSGATAVAAPQMDWVSVVPTGSSAVVTWGSPLERGEVAQAVHVIVLEDGAMTQWKAVTAFERQVVVPAPAGAQVYVVAQSASGFGPLSGPITVTP